MVKDYISNHFKQYEVFFFRWPFQFDLETTKKTHFQIFYNILQPDLLNS